MESEYEKIREIFSEYGIVLKNTYKGKSLRFKLYLTKEIENTDIEALDLRVRSYNCLKRTGISSIGELCNRISCSKDLKGIRNCGDRSVREIMDKLFAYHFSQMSTERQESYIKEIVSLNRLS